MVILGSLISVAIISYLDYATGPEFRYSMYYALPVLLATWYLGRRMGYAAALVSAAGWLTAELNGTARYTRLSHVIVNTISRLLVLILTVFLLSAIKKLSDHLSDMVEQRTAALRDLSIRLSEAEESERRRLAHDVHDGLGQVLTLLKFNLTFAIAEASNGLALSSRLTESVSLVTDLIERCRTLTFDLYPAMLATLGLVPTLRQYAEQFARQAQIEIMVNEEGKMQMMPETMSGYLFRATKELLTNSVKHGKAKQLVLSVYWESNLIRLIVDDDGSGFDASEVFAGGRVQGIGLSGIRQRLASMQGGVTIESTPGIGTRVIMELPFGRQECT